ncbi:hypothetical protein PZQ55_002706 [Clostridium botulinum]|nr:hypothetical protein [Clostridium botulinum]EKO2043674.1 hypothetical protein [Clostridium botulinum]
MWDCYIEDKLIMKSAKEAGERSTDIKLPPNNIQQELKDIGYKIITTSQNIIIKW